MPLLSIGIFFGVLLILFPYNSGDSAVQSPLGFDLWAVWTASGDSTPDYSYCLLVPLVVGYIVYEKRTQLDRIPAQGNLLAIIFLVVGLLLFWVGSRAGKQYLGCTGIQVLLFGFILWFWGGRMFRPLLFAWAFLFFAWPWPFIDSTIAFPMRMIVSHLAYQTLNLIGIGCIQDGTALVSSGNPLTGAAPGSQFQIDIADPCSGIHSLLALMMFSACFSYAFLSKHWQQWVVFLSAMPLVIVGNVVRILLLVIGCLAWGSAFAVGTNAKPSWYHEGCGYLVFAIVLGLECLLGFILIHFDHSPADAPSPSEKAVSKAPDTTTVPVWRSTAMAGVAVVIAIGAFLIPPLQLSQQPGVNMGLPSKIVVPEVTGGGEFFGSDAEVSEVEHRMLPKDTEFARKNYDDFNGHNIFFSIVLSGKQQYVIHPPQVCLVAQGWTITKEEDVPIKVRSGHKFAVRNLSLQREVVASNGARRTVHAYYMYWYVADGVATPSRGERNWISSRDRIFRNRDHRWAYVIAMSTITQGLRTNGLDADQTRDMLAEFIRQIAPFVQKSEAIEGQSVGGN